MVATDRIFAYDEFGLGNVSEAFGNMDRDLAAERNAKTPKVVTSRIRVLLSRPLTWAEKEDLETNTLDNHLRRIDGSDGFRFWVSPGFKHVWAEARFGSRILYEIVAAKLETSYVNVFPRAVRTFREYNGE
jgi:hypothetical protein